MCSSLPPFGGFPIDSDATMATRQSRRSGGCGGPPPCRASQASKYCGAPPQRSRAMCVDLDLEQSLRRGPCDGRVGVVPELGVPTCSTVTIANRSARGRHPSSLRARSLWMIGRARSFPGASCVGTGRPSTGLLLQPLPLIRPALARISTSTGPAREPLGQVDLRNSSHSRERPHPRLRVRSIRRASELA
jgi:hypothetical protein